VLADAANGTFDDLEFDQEKYSWRVGGPNDIPCVHLRDVYRGEKPLEPRPSPFCTKSSCPVTIGDRTPLSLNRTFVSEDDRVLLKSMAFGCVESKGSDAESDRPPPNTATADRGPVFPFRPTTRKRFFEGALFALCRVRISPRAPKPKRRERDADGTSFSSSSRTKKKKKKTHQLPRFPRRVVRVRLRRERRV
jgi:hypothetical protein